MEPPATVTDVKNLIHNIPPEEWEKALNIGEFRGIDVEKVMRRPFSHVCRCRVLGTEGAREVYVKIFQDVVHIDNRSKLETVESEFRTLRYWADKFEGSERFGVVRPVLMIPEQALLVTEAAEGVSLARVVARQARFFPAARVLQQLETDLYNVGEWLRYFHTITAIEDELFSIDEFVQYMDVRLKALTEEKGRHVPRHYRERILQFIEHSREHLEPPHLRLARTHGDFNLGNILLHGNRVTVLDFGEVEKASIYLDLARVYHQLYLMTMKPIYRPTTIQRLQRALLEGYGTPEIEGTRIFRLLLVRHTVTHLVTITRFWLKKPKEKVYNYWVMRNELNFLDRLMR